VSKPTAHAGESQVLSRLTGAAAVLMTLVLLWSTTLSAGFAWAAFAGPSGSTFGRTAGFLAIAAFLALLAMRTGWELLRRLIRGRDR
jgi:hypothetical protein